MSKDTLANEVDLISDEVDRSPDREFEAVKAALIHVLGDAVLPEDLRPETPLWDSVASDLGVVLDSLDVLDMVVTLEEEFGCEILDTLDPSELVTLGDLAAALRAPRQVQPPTD